MSLIYSALNKLEHEQGTPGSLETVDGNPYVADASKPGMPRWIYFVILGCLVLVLVGWLSTSALRAKFAAPQSVKPVAEALPVVVAPIAVAAVADLPVQTAAVSAMTPVQAPALMPEPLAAVTVSPAAPALVKTVLVKTRARVQPRPPVEIVTETAPAPELDPQETEQLTKATQLAIQSGKNEEAESLLKKLALRLPAESITLLRLNAWHQMQSGDPAKAMVLYRQITERLPGDESAGINLALLHWKAGQQGEARRLMGALAERHPESETVQKYSRELGAPR